MNGSIVRRAYIIFARTTSITKSNNLMKLESGKCLIPYGDSDTKSESGNGSSPFEVCLLLQGFWLTRNANHPMRILAGQPHKSVSAGSNFVPRLLSLA